MKALVRKLRKWIGPLPVPLPGMPPVRSHWLRRDRPELHLRDPGRHRLDRFVDEPPSCDWASTPPPKVKHLRLNLWGHASTSIALVIRKAA